MMTTPMVTGQRWGEEVSEERPNGKEVSEQQQVIC